MIEKAKVKVFNLLDYFKTFENSDGLLEDLEGWIFVDWSKANDADFVKGVNYPTNMLYAAMLQAAGDQKGSVRLIHSLLGVIKGFKKKKCSNQRN